VRESLPCVLLHLEEIWDEIRPPIGRRR